MPDPAKKVRYKTDEEYGEQFRSLLEESVRCRLRSTTPAGVLMSGGLDSTSVACLAARMTAAKPLTAISYVFDELTDCDERVYIDAVRDQYGLRSIQIPCDDAWPCKDWQTWPFNPNYPEANPYRLLKERAYYRAHREGLRVLLTGGFGDHLYSGAEDWWADLHRDKRVQESFRELAYHLWYAGVFWTLDNGFLQRAVRHLTRLLPGGRSLRRRQRAPVWLTSTAARYLSLKEVDIAPEIREGLVGVSAAMSSSSEIHYSNRHMLELRHPYRDRRLVEYVLGLPAYLLYYRGAYKRILRMAMRGILPESVRTRAQPTSLVPLFSRGIERERTVLQAHFHAPDAIWRIHVRADWLLGFWNSPGAPKVSGPQALIPWLCASYVSWDRSHRISNLIAF
jgi:asparagine synthase (glutamine-hydrolysing)